MSPRTHASEEPEVPTGQINLPPPPRIEPTEGAAGVLAGAVPMLGSVGSLLIVAVLASGGSGSSMRTRSLLAGGMFACATLAYVLVQVDRQRRQQARQIGAARAEYQAQLGQVRQQARAAADAQRRALAWHHLHPAELVTGTGLHSRLPPRGPEHPYYLRLRCGLSTQPLTMELVTPAEASTGRSDPASTAALHRLIAVHQDQPNLPAVVDLSRLHRFELRGPIERQRALARAMVCHASATHTPDHLAVAVLCAEDRLPHWDWVKWLPHANSAVATDAAGPCRLVATAPADLLAWVPDQAHLLLLTDSDAPFELPDRPATTLMPLVTLAEEPAAGPCLDLSGPSYRGRVPLRVSGSLMTPTVQPSQTAQPSQGYADQVDLATASAWARTMSPQTETSLIPGTATSGSAPALSLTGLLGITAPKHWNPAATWGTRRGDDRLRVPIGTDPDGRPVHVNLKESAQGGMGPHGLVVGATGSGKSEFLRSLVLGLAMTHSPAELNLVLVDFKGGATFAGMTSMPHTSAVITNLARELTLVERMADALTGEMVRRQELLRATGNHASVRDYEAARASGQPLDPLPSLFIVVDEFSELLAAKPELIELFIAVGRLGRSLGLHLLLASQRLEEGRLRGLESHLSYRIGLRTFSAAESRTVLGVPDAHHLPPVPGLGYLRTDPTTLQQFRAAYASGPADHDEPVTLTAATTTPEIWPFSVLHIDQEKAPTTTQPASPNLAAPATAHQPTLLDVVVERMVGHGPTAHRVWLPPLDVPETLGTLMPDLVVDPKLGLISPTWRARPGLVVPLGTIDRPREQRHEDLAIDLAGASGHVAVVGGPRSGRSTVLRTLVAGYALTRTAQEMQFFVLDFSGGMGPVTRLPHVSGAAGRPEPDVVRRIVAEVGGILRRREEHFRDVGVDSIETYRSRVHRRAASGFADAPADGYSDVSSHGARNVSDEDHGDGYGDVVLLIDGWSTLRTDAEDLEQEIHQLATRGLTYGVHLVVAADRWGDFRAGVRDLFGTRLELRLGDPADSELDRRAAARVPTRRPGRGLSPSGEQALFALPRIDRETEPATLSDATADLVQRVTEAWPGPVAPPLRLLPHLIERTALTTDEALQGSDRRSRLLLGVEEQQLSPVLLDPDREPHLLVLGDGESGKTSTLRTYAQEVMRTRTPQQAQVVVVDPRRSLLGEIPDDYLLNYLTSMPKAQEVLTDLVSFLNSRLPGDGVDPEQLRRRAWWTGAEVFVLVDDYELAVSGPTSPVSAVAPLLAHGHDVGLHLVLARRTGGAARAGFDPVFQSLRDLGQPALLLAGDPDEGPLVGRLRPEPGPPGRGRLVTRAGGVQVVQAAWTPPTA